MPGCPCGSERRGGENVIDYIDEAALRALIPSIDVDSWAPILSTILGTAVDIDLLCVSPPPTPPSPEKSWFKDWYKHLADILQVVNAVRWPLLCACKTCPPVSGCTGGTSYELTAADGYFESGSCYAYKFHLVDADVYLKATGCDCAGNFTGDVFIQWNPPQNQLLPNPSYPDDGPEFIGGCGGVTEWTLSFDGSGAGQSAVCNTHGSSGVATIWQNGGGGEPNFPWPNLPTTVEPLPDPPSCTEESQCEAIDYLGRTITELIWQTAAIGNRVAGVETDVTAIAGPYSIDIPGLSGPITGSLAEVLPKLFQALAPPTQEQLTTEWTEIVTATDTLDVSGLSVLVCQLSVVPPSFGQQGEAQVRYSNTWIAPAPAVVSLLTSDGVYSRHPIDNEGATVIPLVPLVVSCAIDLQAGVELTLSGLSRAV